MRELVGSMARKAENKCKHRGAARLSFRRFGEDAFWAAFWIRRPVDAFWMLFWRRICKALFWRRRPRHALRFGRGYFRDML